MSTSDIIDLSLNVVNNPTVPVLLLQFAAEHANEEAEAKLARQIPRHIGRKLNLTDRFDARFLSFRDRVGGAQVFINSTQLPEPDALDEIAAHHGIRWVVYGKVGIGERIRMEAHIYDAAQRRVLFRKGFETYATYTFDVFDELCVRVEQIAGIELSRGERVRLFQRDTLSWEAFLYYMLAEDDRYGASVGVPPLDDARTREAYLAALERDPEFEAAEIAAVSFAVESLEGGRMSYETAESFLTEIARVTPMLTASRQALMFIAVENGNVALARRTADELLALRPDDLELRGEIEELMEDWDDPALR